MTVDPVHDKGERVGTTPDSRGIHSPTASGVPEPTVSESVADESQESVTTETADPAATAATDFEAQATEYKNRFSGSQKKLTETLKTLKQLEEERDALATFKAQAERANMSELEALKADLAAARSEAGAARALAERNALLSRFPLSFATLGDATPTDETALAALEAKLAGQPAPEAEPEARIDPNQPRKIAPTPPDPMAAADAWWRGTLQGN